MHGQAPFLIPPTSGPEIARSAHCFASSTVVYEPLLHTVFCLWFERRKGVGLRPQPTFLKGGVCSEMFSSLPSFGSFPAPPPGFSFAGPWMSEPLPQCLCMCPLTKGIPPLPFPHCQDALLDTEASVSHSNKEKGLFRQCRESAREKWASFVVVQSLNRVRLFATP